MHRNDTPTTPPVLPGYQLLSPLGCGATAEVWEATEDTTADRVAVKQPRVPHDPLSLAQLSKEAEILSGPPHPHIVVLRRIVVGPRGLTLVLDCAEGGSLASLLAVRRQISAAEMVTVGSAIALALAELHSRNVVHGDVAPGNILFTGDGRPLLSDFGSSRVVGDRGGTVSATTEYLDPAVRAGGIPGPAGDIYALGSVCRAALGEATGVPSELKDLLAAMTHPHPASRPWASTVAAQLPLLSLPSPVRFPRDENGTSVASGTLSWAVTVGRAVPAESIGESITGPEAGAAPPRHARRRRSLWRRATAHPRVAMLLAAMTAAGLWSGVVVSGSESVAGNKPAVSSELRSSELRSSAVRGEPRHQTVIPWRAVAQTLEDRRAAAITTVNLSRLSSVYAPGSPAQRRDAATVRSLITAQWHPRGFGHRLVTVESASGSGTRVTLTVSGQLPPYQLLDKHNRVVQAFAASLTKRWAVQLISAPNQFPGWLIFEIEEKT
jgi:eukaryotic-like serine/threonine-protein kinase